MTDRLYVDPSGLAKGGGELGQWSLLANRVVTRVRDAVAVYGHAGGTGEMGEQFDANYKPGESNALQFLVMLEKIVGGQADRTLMAARTFEQTSSDADGAARNQ